MYRPTNALLVRRAVLHPSDFGPWPDPGATTEPSEPSHEWLKHVLAMPEFASALEQSTPALADRARAAIRGIVADRDTRRVVLAVMRYALRGTSRATPFGWFAGVAPARLGDRTQVRHGRRHLASVRMPAVWIDTRVAELEADPAVQPLLPLQANNLIIETSTHFVLNNRAGVGRNAKPVHVRIRTTPLVRTTLALARDPLPAALLAAKLAATAGVTATSATTVVSRLIEQQFLLTALRPPMTAPDPLGHLITELARVTGSTVAATADAERVQDQPGSPNADERRAMKLAALRQIAAISGGPHARNRAHENLTEMLHHVSDAESRPAVDVRLDCDVTVAGIVVREAANAASVLTRIAALPRDGWPAWHRRFLDRYGPHALVPVLDVIDADKGLGLPAGFHGGPPATPPSLSDRDRWLLHVAQRAALTHQREIFLDEAALDALTTEKPVPQPTTEVTLRVNAETTSDIDRGDFSIELIGMSSWAGRTIGRFLPLFPEADRHRIADAYSQRHEPLAVQISAPGPYAVTADLARAPRILPYLLPIGEYHDEQPGLVRLDDIAVTADAERLYLVWMPEGRPILPVTMNAVESSRFTLPIVRFLTEAPVALDPRCSGFDWGAAGTMPYLPAVRFGRAILSPAMWLLQSDALTRDAAAVDFDTALTAWKEAVSCPDIVYLGDGDQLIRIDLAQPGHRTLLHDHLTRKGRVRLRASATENNEWIGGYAHELVVPLTAIEPIPSPSIRTTTAIRAREHGSLPVGTDHTFVKIYCHPPAQTVILTTHLPSLIDGLSPGIGYWFQRYADLRPHLRLRLAGPIDANVLASWLNELREAGLTGDVQICTDFPETSRFGGPDAFTAAERFFITDSEAARQQLIATEQRPGPPAQALTAASLLDIARAAFVEPDTGMGWLIANTRAHRPAPVRTVYKAAIAAADPHRGLLSTLPNAPLLLAAWHNRAAALAEYTAALAAAGTSPDQLLPDLLHLHHARIAGPDIDGERACLHLARAAALSWRTRTRRPS